MPKDTIVKSLNKASASDVRVEKEKVVIVGTGGSGTSHVSNLLGIDGVEIVALCDLDQKKADNAAGLCEKAGRKKPAVYYLDGNTHKEMLEKAKPDAVLIATYWDSHTAIALDAMNKGIYSGIEVPASLTVEDAWKLVETSEKTGSLETIRKKI